MKRVLIALCAIPSPEEFLDWTAGQGKSYGCRDAAFPTRGGATLGTPALSARYSDGYGNTELYYASHSVSGGFRVDYGAMKYFNEFWASDDTDALERIFIQYGTNLIYPACATASHVSKVPNHQSGNITPFKFRFDVASSGRLGMELQPKDLTEEEVAFADRAVKSYYRYRVEELNVDSSCYWGSGRSFSGEFLLEGGFNPRLNKTFASAVFLLEAE